ncbi:unnamed protein product, partial [Sphacelaria rigidula]
MLENKVALTTVGTVKPLRPACMSHGAGQPPAVPSKLQSDQDCFSPVSHSSKQLSPTSTFTSFPRRRPSLTVYEIQHSSTAPLAMQNPPCHDGPSENTFAPEDQSRIYFSTIAQQHKSDVAADHLSEYGPDL